MVHVHSSLGCCHPKKDVLPPHSGRSADVCACDLMRRDEGVLRL
jgi:hypothetical protein